MFFLLSSFASSSMSSASLAKPRKRVDVTIDVTNSNLVSREPWATGQSAGTRISVVSSQFFPLIFEVQLKIFQRERPVFLKWTGTKAVSRTHQQTILTTGPSL